MINEFEVREVHGVKTAMKHTAITLTEAESAIAFCVIDENGSSRVAHISADNARRLAGRILRLARRIEARREA